MKFTKSVKCSANVFLVGISLFSVMACTGTDMKGNDKPKAHAKIAAPVINTNAKDTADSVGKVECKTGEVLKGINADKTPICAPLPGGAQTGTVSTDAKTGTETKTVVENTTCSPGTADLTTFTSESNQNIELHVISMSESVSPGEPVQVVVKKREKPVVIFLRVEFKTSDKIKWEIKLEEGVQVSKIYSDASVSGIDPVKVEKPPYNFSNVSDERAWVYPSSKSIDVIDFAQKSSGLTLKKFQGCRVSNKFVIN